MSALNIEQIKREATGRLDVARKTEELQGLVDRIYPGYKVILSKEKDDEAANRNGQKKFAHLPQLEQIETVLREQKGTIELRPLFAELQSRGTTMSFTTLMSLLSKYKKMGRIRSFGRGIWGLPQYIRSEP